MAGNGLRACTIGLTALVGLAEKGPVNGPTLASNWMKFSETICDFVDGSYLAHCMSSRRKARHGSY